MKQLYVILKKYPSLDMTIVCLRYGKTSHIHKEYLAEDCFESRQAAQSLIDHFQYLGSSAKYRIVEVHSIGKVVHKNT